MGDSTIRVSVLGMAQRSLERAELSDAELRDEDPLDKALRLRAMQAQIGRELRMRVGLPRELPHRMLWVLVKLDDGST
jgi:hypothetical protein